MRHIILWALCPGLGAALLRTQAEEPETCPTVRELPRDRFAAGAKSLEVLSPSCPSSFCRTKTCVHCALKPGQRLRAFVDRLKRFEGTSETVHFMTLGNSVARRDGAATTRTALRSIEDMFPTVHFNLEITSLEGGFVPEHMYNTIQASPWEYSKFDVFMVQYHNFAAENKAEELIRLLLDMERKPLVILVQHCPLDTFNGSSKELKEEEGMFELAEHYSLPLVSACSAMRVMLAEEPGMNLHRLSERMFIPAFRLGVKEVEFFTDPVHYTESGEQMEGCLVADMIKSAQANALYAPSQAADPKELPAPLGKLDTRKCVFMNSTMDNHFWPNITNGSWEFRTGGEGGRKRWLQPVSDTAVLSFKAPRSSKISIEFYMHHERAMGAVDVLVDGRHAARADACCPRPCVGIPGRGFYYTYDVAVGLPLTEHFVEIRSVKKQSTSCAELGNNFSLVGVLGFAHPDNPRPLAKRRLSLYG